MNQRVSAYQRLLDIPEIFRGAELTMRFQWTSKKTSQYLYMWAERGLIEPFGGHSDVYANLVRNRTPKWEVALQKAMPSALVIGVDALRRAGVTTQIMHRPEIAVLSTDPVYKADRYTLVPKSARYFSRVRPGIIRQDNGLQVLRPEWALADLLSSGGWKGFPLDPDDFDWDGGLDRDELRKAILSMKLSADIEEQALLSDPDSGGDAPQP
ncbi:hypothetical protein FE249_19015 (plasmid) [Acidiphilium multivorum]|uniref:hypothetical protein n=1 Tax=Acidiphilium multivorum TaxID=62140 RepID=UPI001F4C14A6|nr:hypothetical protein [Acidiphilium multivorum]UNC16303.1 hypothetical protein FE249_19015 [Acidiphilium multivorum]